MKKSIFSYIHALFFKDQWVIAYRINDSHDVNFATNKNIFNVISFPKHFWGADPFLVDYDDKIYLYFEYTNEKKGKSVIACKEIYPFITNNIAFVYEDYGHVSYPCIFKYDKELFMIPETLSAKKIIVLKYDVALNKWINYSEIRKEINAVDTTFVLFQGKPCVFIYEVVDVDYRLLHFCKLNDDLKSIVSDTIVKTYHEKNGRPGGKCIVDDHRMYRIVQPGINYYGEKILVNDFWFENNIYHEENKCVVNPEDICVNTKRRIKGIHTYNKVNNVEVIDCLVKGSFNLFRPFTILFRKIGIFGYNNYDKKKKKIFNVAS